jgi:hypothetical protein
MCKIIFPRELFEDLNKFLFSTAPRENGCFLLANSYKTKSKKTGITITEIIKPNEDSWNTEGEHSLEPSSSFINQAVVLADSSKSSLIFVHTHPHSHHPAKFSPIDEKSNKELFANISQILQDTPLGSFVFSEHGIYGVIYNSRKIRPVTTVTLSGKHISNIPVVGSKPQPKQIDSKFDRQTRALGKYSQYKLQDLTVAIVGVGGTGSPLSIQLARMGVKKLLLIDKDVLDKTNIPRVYGSKEKDIGKPKVEILKKHMKSFSATKVEAIQADITTENVVPYLINSDVIFGCTDNLSSRAVLNDISVQYHIPLIDVGCRIHLNKNRSIDQAVMKVQVVTPDTACLWCTETLDGKTIMQESLSTDEKKKLAEEGYYQDLEDQPSIISMTTMASSMAVNKLLSLLGTFGDDYSSRTQIELKDGFMINDTPSIKDNCVCIKRKGKANNRRII